MVLKASVIWYLMALQNLLSRTKNQPKEEVFGTDISRTSGGHSRGYPGPKLRSGQVKILEKQAFQRGHPWPEGADVHDPKGFPKTSVRKTLGWIFVPRSLKSLTNSGWPHFGSVTVRAWDSSSGSGFPFRRFLSGKGFCFCISIRTRSTTTRDRNLRFRGAVSTGGSPLDFLLFLQYLCAIFSKTSPRKSGESSEKSSVENRVKSCHVCGCHGFSALIQSCLNRKRRFRFRFWFLKKKKRCRWFLFLFRFLEKQFWRFRFGFRAILQTTKISPNLYPMKCETN